MRGTDLYQVAIVTRDAEDVVQTRQASLPSWQRTVEWIDALLADGRRMLALSVVRFERARE